MSWPTRFKRCALRWRGVDVRHVINITDVGHLIKDADEGEDKVEEPASRLEGRSVEDITSSLHPDLLGRPGWALNVIPPDHWPKATEYVPQDDRVRPRPRGTRLRLRLLPLGPVLRHRHPPADYGELAGLDFEGMLEGARFVHPVEGRRRKTDFACAFTEDPGGAG